MKDTQKHYTGDESKKARQSSSMGLIMRQKEPSNLETPFDQVDSFLTPTELFYIGSHFPGPSVKSRLLPAAYRWCGQESVFSELPGIARQALRDAGRHFGVRRQWSGLSYPTCRRSTVGARRSRQCGMDRGAAGSFAGARWHRRRCL